MRTARLAMRHRAVVLRNQRTITERGRYNAPLPPAFEPLEDPLPCRLWSRTERTVEGPDVNVVVEDLRMMVPLDADLTTADRIDGVTDRRGRVIDDRILRIDADQVIPGSHRELMLTAIAGGV
jgi:hypothetical protein